VSTSIETDSGPVPATARSAARRTEAAPATPSERRNGATWAMPSRHAASSAGAASPVGTVTTDVRTASQPAAAASRASASGSPPRDPGVSDPYHAGGR
jgi:hypothetical protein